MMLKIIALFYPIIVLILVTLFFRFFNISKLTEFKVPDVATIFIILGLKFFSTKFHGINFLPYFITVVAGMGIALLLVQLFRYKEFKLKAFLKIFWRMTFFLALIAFYAITIMSFIK